MARFTQILQGLALVTPRLSTAFVFGPPTQTYVVGLHHDAPDAQSHLAWIGSLASNASPQRPPVEYYHIGDWRGACVVLPSGERKLVEDNGFVKSVEPVSSTMQFASIIEQKGVSWNLASLSRSASKLHSTNATSYFYDETAGEGTFAYVLDSGINVTNPEFEGRATHGFDAAEGVDPLEDWDEHGTMVAGIIGSKTYGVAKKVSIIDVKVSRASSSEVSLDDCSVLRSLEWAVNNITNTPGRASKSVINASITGTKNIALNDAFTAAHEAGILIITASGNYDSPASEYSPASAPFVVTVGAVSWNNIRASFSNSGSRVNLFAPGVDVMTIGKEGEVRVVAGTSFSSPHVAGLALHLKAKEQLMTPNDTVRRILELAQKDVVIDVKDGHNRLAHLGPFRS